MEDTRLYIADLRKYNGGHLHGVWIDFPNDDYQEEIQKMLGENEEYAIHDYESPLKIDEYSNVEKINEFAKLEEDDQRKILFLVEQGLNLGKALEYNLEDLFYHEGTLRDLAEQNVNDGHYGEISEAIKPYIDYDKIAHDLDCNGYVEMEDGVYLMN